MTNQNDKQTNNLDYFNEINLEEINLDTETNLETETNFSYQNTILALIEEDETTKMNIKIKSDDHPYIFKKIKQLYKYIKIISTTNNGYYKFTLSKCGYKITINMDSPKKIFNYILTYHTQYSIIE